MRKEIKSKSKRKWIVGGGLFFGGIALLTTGFATWIVGTQITEKSGETTVTIDTVEDKTLIFDATVTEGALYIGEETKDTGLIKVENGKATDFEVTINVKITKGATVTKPTKVNLAFNTTYTNAEAKVLTEANFKVTPDKDSTFTGHVTSKEYSYLTTLASFDLDPTGWTNETTYSFDHTIKLLSWGDYFGEKAPTAYYDGVGTTKSITTDVPDTYQAFMSEVKTELDAFTAAIKEGTKTTVLPLLLTIA